jgi:hypothetical protein
MSTTMLTFKKNIVSKKKNVAAAVVIVYTTTFESILILSMEKFFATPTCDDKQVR